MKNDLITYENIWKIATSHGDDYTTGCWLEQQEEHDADPKAMEQINFTGNLDTAEQTMFFIIEEAKETILDFSQGTVKVLWMSSYILVTACLTSYCVVFCFSIMSV